ASFSADGQRLAFATNVRGRYEPAIAHLEGGRVRNIEYLTQNIHDETEPVWRPDGRGLLYLHSEESEVAVRRVFGASHATHAVADRPGVHASPKVGPDSDMVATSGPARASRGTSTSRASAWSRRSGSRVRCHLRSTPRRSSSPS